MITISDYITSFPSLPATEGFPWELTGKLEEILNKMISGLDENYVVREGIAIHKSATVESSAIIKGPAIISENCFIGNNVVIRGGALLLKAVRIGPGCEIKSSIICENSTIAHFNFIGDSIIGANVNFEAGAVIANHYNEKINKNIFVISESGLTDTGVEKFGALVGDNCRIGANAVLSPGTILKPRFIVRRLELIEQQ